MRTLVFAFLILSAYPLAAQFGVSGGYRFNRPDQWLLHNDADQSETELLGDGFSISADYWFRLKNVRVEFLPELNYSSFKTSLFNGLETRADFFSLFFNVNFYPMDFYGDCDCPTFSKSGDTFQKGFFLQVSPGFSYAPTKLELPEETIEEQMSGFSIGAGLGFDIGLSDLLTISPTAGLRYFPGLEWPQLSRANLGVEEHYVEGEKSALWQIYTGIRLGWRLDH